MTAKLETWFKKMPVVAILRGIKPNEAIEIGEALYDAGIGIIEVPLNSPEPLDSIKALSETFGKDCVIGAGTVTSEDQASAVAAAGGEIIVSPNTNAKVISKTIELGLTPMPGWASVTEAFTAYEAGARYLKLFPAASYGSGHIKACKAVLPTDCKALAVGGVGAEHAAEWLSAGVDGFGIGSEIYAAGYTAEDVSKRAQDVVKAIYSVST